LNLFRSVCKVPRTSTGFWRYWPPTRGHALIFVFFSFRPSSGSLLISTWLKGSFTSRISPFFFSFTPPLIFLLLVLLFRAALWRSTGVSTLPASLPLVFFFPLEGGLLAPCIFHDCVPSSPSVRVPPLLPLLFALKSIQVLPPFPGLIRE